MPGPPTRGPSGRQVEAVQRLPSTALAPFVQALHYHEGGHGYTPELLLPTGCMHLVVNLSQDETLWYGGDGFTHTHRRAGTVVAGAHLGPVCTGLTRQPAMIAVLFRPGGAYPFFATPASALDEPFVELETLWGRAGAILRERLLEASTPQAAMDMLESVLLARAVRALEPDRGVAAAVTALGRGAAVTEVAERLGLSERTLQRRFAERVGLPPKRFARVRRLHRLLASIPRGCAVDWAGAALEYGYYDQAHLINEFRSLTGMTPAAYRPLPVGRRLVHHHAALPA